MSDYRKLESFLDCKSLRLMLPSTQIKKLNWKSGDYVKIYCKGKKMIIERITK